MTTLAIDNETFLITRERPLPPVVCLSWADGERSAVIPHTSVEALMGEKLRDQNVRFVGHNIAFDMGTIAASWPSLLPLIFDAYRNGRVTDTGIRQQLYDIATGRVQGDDRVQGYSLARLYQHIFGNPMPGPGKGEDTYRLRYAELYDVDFAQWPDEAIDYSRCDAEGTHAIWKEQERVCGPQMDRHVRDDAFQTYAAFCLALISAQGMRTDPHRTATFRAEQEAVMKALQPELVSEGMLEPQYRGRGKDKHQVGWTKKQRPAQERMRRTCEDKGIDPMLTPAGEKARKANEPVEIKHISIDKTACVWADDAMLLRRAAYVTAEKMITTYLPMLEAGTEGPITSRFNLAATGRTTSSSPGAPAVGGNQQNAPRVCKRVKQGSVLEDSPIGVRECFTPRPGHVFLSGDFSGAELHAVAQWCKDHIGYSTLGDALSGGLDAHLVLACYLLGGTRADYDDVKLRKQQGDPEVDQARQNAKPANFGFWGGMGVPTFMKIQLKEGVRWTVEEARALRTAWGQAWEESTEFFEANKLELGPSGKAVTETHRTRRLRKVRGFSTMCNDKFQPRVADGAKLAICEVVRQCLTDDDPQLPLRAAGARPVNFIHDELVLEVVDPCPKAAVDEFVDIMQDEFNVLVPDYPTEVEPVLSYVLSKRAKSVYDDEGRLVPWKP